MFLPHWPLPMGNNRDYEKGLQRVKHVLGRLGNPQHKLPPVIHVAGTNGKGSTVAFLKAILETADLNVHAYSSPHIYRVNERIILAGQEIDDGYLYEILEEVRLACENNSNNDGGNESNSGSNGGNGDDGSNGGSDCDDNGKVDVSFMEGMTCAAILAFSRVKADVCLIETGMGGRVDATNIIDDKMATVITPISYDHTEFLGEDIAAIAAEKAHIMRSGVPCVVGPQARRAGAMVEIRGLEIGTAIFNYGSEFGVGDVSDDGEKFSYWFGSKSEGDIVRNFSAPKLLGEHQLINASMAIAAVDVIRKLGSWDLIDRVEDEHVEAAMSQVEWPSRLQKVKGGKLVETLGGAENAEIYIDGAHNVGGAYALAQWIAEERMSDMENKDGNVATFIVCGFTRGKDRTDYFLQLKDVVDGVFGVRVEGEPNPESAENVAAMARKAKCDNVFACEDMWDAFVKIAKIVEICGDSDDAKVKCRAVICGSLYLGRDAVKYS